MMVIDTSALMAITLEEVEARRCIEAIQAEEMLVISAGTLTETLIVAGQRGVADEMKGLIERLHLQIAPVTATSAYGAAEAHARWGRGRKGLNFGDCFAYQAAREAGCPLLFVGEDFRQTDIEAA